MGDEMGTEVPAFSIGVFRSAHDRQWYWRVYSTGNHEIVLSSEGYHNYGDIVGEDGIIAKVFPHVDVVKVDGRRADGQSMLIHKDADGTWSQ